MIYKPFDNRRVYVAASHIADPFHESCTMVLDWETMEDVAVLCEKAQPVRFLDDTLALLKEYHSPLWAIELTPIGTSAAGQVQADYPNIYWHGLNDFGTALVVDAKPGWPWSQVCREALIDTIRRLIPIPTNDKRFVDELAGMTVDDHGQRVAKQGSEISRVIARGIALHIRDLSGKPEPEFSEPQLEKLALFREAAQITPQEASERLQGERYEAYLKSLKPKKKVAF